MIKKLEILAKEAFPEAKVQQFFEHGAEYRKRYYGYKLEMLKIREEEAKRRFERYASNNKP